MSESTDTDNQTRREAALSKMLLHATAVCVISNLGIRSLSVGPRGVVFVSEEGLQLSDAAAHSGNLRPDNKDMCDEN